jgi:DNA-binding CsgD family transcriptional regulator
MSRATLASTDGLIANLYEATMEPAVLMDFLQELAVRTESRSVHLTVFDDRSGAVLLDAAGGVVGTTPEELAEIRREYDHTYASIDYRRIHLTALPIGSWFQCHEVFPPQRLKRERFFREFIQKWDYRYFAGIRMGQGSGLTTYLGLNRRAEQGPHDAEDMRFLRQLTIHLMRAAKMFYKTRSFRTHFAPSLESLQYLPTGIFILDQWQRVLFANNAAETLFRQDFGVNLNDGVLEVNSSGLRKKFYDEVGRVIASGVPSAVLLKTPDGPRGSGKPCYLLRLPASSESYQLRGDPAVLVLIPQATPCPQEGVTLLRTLYGLSRREADLATAVANGATPQDYAHLAGLEISTVRSQLKSVFQKTGTHRQTELVRLLSVLPRITLV